MDCCCGQQERADEDASSDAADAAVRAQQGHPGALPRPGQERGVALLRPVRGGGLQRALHQGAGEEARRPLPALLAPAQPQPRRIRLSRRIQNRRPYGSLRQLRPASGESFITSLVQRWAHSYARFHLFLLDGTANSTAVDAFTVDFEFILMTLLDEIMDNMVAAQKPRGPIHTCLYRMTAITATQTAGKETKAT